MLQFPAWSADGKLLAFVRYDGLFVVAPDGTGLRKVKGDLALGRAVWSPARNELAVMGRHGILRVGLSGAPSHNLSRSPAADVDPAWSPDGRRVAFASNRSGNHDIYIVNRNGRDLRRLTRHPLAEVAPVWSPDGRSIAFRRHSPHHVAGSSKESVVVINADGGAARELMSFVPEETLDRCCWRVEWSPGGQRVVTDLGARITVIDALGGKIWTIAARGIAPHWSPDGRRILFEGWRPFDCSGQPGICVPVAFTGVWTIRPDGTHRRSLADRAKLPLGAMDASWSPEGRRIAAVLEHKDGSRSLVVLNVPNSASPRQG